MSGPAPLLRAARFDDGQLTMHLGNGLGAIADGQGALADFGRREQLAPGIVNRLEVIMEEVVANIIRHGFAEGSAQSILVEVAIADGDVQMVFEDDGVPFDPTRQPPPTPFTSLADAQIGGLGIALVRRLSRAIAYTRLAGAGDAAFSPVNQLTVRVAATAAPV